jgi:hypothetical protein
MASFPNTVVPKNLKPETQNEVPGSPVIYNAADYNFHLRELIAIEKMLVGKGMSAGADSSLTSVLINAINAYNSLSNGGLLAKVSGTIQAGTPIPIPPKTLVAHTVGSLPADATTISVDFTAGFPVSGTLTKFNSVHEYAAFGENILESYVMTPTNRITSQEVITYNGTTPTAFLNCTRKVEGDAQDVPYWESATLIGGRASVMLGLNSWTGSIPLAVPPQSGVLQVDHDAALNTYAYAGGTQYAAGVLLNYSMIISKTFGNIDPSDILG